MRLSLSTYWPRGRVEPLTGLAAMAGTIRTDEATVAATPLPDRSR